MKKQEVKNKTDVQDERKWYRERIIEMVREVEDVWILEQICKFVVNMTDEGD